MTMTISAIISVMFNYRELSTNSEIRTLLSYTQDSNNIDNPTTFFG